jgi:regulator of protease activity HflC (stomatin/prohibitin superfamily)
MLALLIALAAVVFAVAFGPVTYRASPVVPEYNRLVVFRLGRCIGQKGPGVVWLWPILDRAVAVDLRERVLEGPQQTTITKANAPLSIDFLVDSRIVNPVESVVHVADFARASQGLATTTLRAVIGDGELDAVLSRRDEINRLLQTKLDEVTARWGVKVTSVEIREIVPPRDVQEAMDRQLSAERTRRANPRWGPLTWDG